MIFVIINLLSCDTPNNDYTIVPCQFRNALVDVY